MSGLYHFAALHMVEGIRRDGLTMGGMLAPDMRTIRHGWRWLTDDPSWDGQGWATQNHIKYDRAAARFTVRIPPLELHRLHRWVSIAPLLGYEPWWLEEFHRVGGAEHWRVFRGDIPPSWLGAPEFKSATVEATA